MSTLLRIQCIKVTHFGTVLHRAPVARSWRQKLLGVCAHARLWPVFVRRPVCSYLKNHNIQILNYTIKHLLNAYHSWENFSFENVINGEICFGICLRIIFSQPIIINSFMYLWWIIIKKKKRDFTACQKTGFASYSNLKY